MASLNHSSAALKRQKENSNVILQNKITLKDYAKRATHSDFMETQIKVTKVTFPLTIPPSYSFEPEAHLEKVYIKSSASANSQPYS